MSNPDDEPTIGVSDEQLPEDLRPSEDNPLAQGLEPGETVEGALEGKGAEQDAEDRDDAGSSGEPDRAE